MPSPFGDSPQACCLRQLHGVNRAAQAMLKALELEHQRASLCR